MGIVLGFGCGEFSVMVFACREDTTSKDGGGSPYTFTFLSIFSFVTSEGGGVGSESATSATGGMN